MSENPFAPVRKIPETSSEANIGLVKELLSEEEAAAYASLDTSKSVPEREVEGSVSLDEAEKEVTEVKIDWGREEYIEWAKSFDMDEGWVDTHFTFHDDGTVSCDTLELPATSITSLPGNLQYVEGSLNLHGCASLAALPEDMVIERSLYLSGCTSLTGLPPTLTVKKSIFLESCTSFKNLPKNFVVGEDLILDGCTALSSLPEGLNVKGLLSVFGCTALKWISDGVSAEEVILEKCPSLHMLPDSLMAKKIIVPKKLLEAANQLKERHTTLSINVVDD